MSYEVVDFSEQVIEASHRLPVFVDFWAAWCGPCRMVGPVLEKLAAEAAGRWTLVKVDTEAHPDLAAQYGIRSIPNMKLFVRGQVTAELAGALPEAQLRQWLEQHIPSEARNLVSAARTELDTGRAKTLLAQALAMEPNLAEAGILLARLELADNPAHAEALALRFQNAEGGEDLLHLIVLAREVLPQDSSAAARLAAQARQALAQTDWPAAAERLLELARTDRRFADNFAARGFRALFRMLGSAHPVTQKYRRQADMALY